MELRIAAKNVLDQLVDIVNRIHPNDFVRPVSALNSATIGQHIRHTLEFFTCLADNVEEGVICYDNRQHNREIEESTNLTLQVIDGINEFLDQFEPDKEVILEVGYDANSDSRVRIRTNYKRELAYNIEHAVHHMAIIKIGIHEICPYILLPEGFGVANSTIRHLKKQKIG